MQRLFIGLILISVGLSSQAQHKPDTIIYHVTTIDGNEFNGIIVSQSEEYVLLETQNIGQVRLPKSQIASMNPVKGRNIKSGEVWPDHFQATRYFISGSAYTMKKGEAMYQNTWIFYNHFSAGLTDHFSIGLGFIPSFLFGSIAIPYWITPKFSIPVSRDKLNFGGGAFLGSVTGGGEMASFLYGNTTIGTKDTNLTFGLGYGRFDGEWSRTPLMMVGGSFRTSRHFYLLTENYFILGEGIFFLGGRRIIRRTSLDFGLMIPGGVGQFIGIPWLAIIVPLHKG
ncbi:MAG: hypothetical protein ABJN36_01795 [Cyclobacteriaceae bacterium]